MVYSFKSPRDRMKAVWGRRFVTSLTLLALLVIWAAPADAQRRPKAGKHGRVQHAKLDRELNDKMDGIGDSDVIVEFFEDSDSSDRISKAGGKSGRRLGNIKGAHGPHAQRAAEASR